MVPATLRTGSLTSQGVLAMTMRHGRLLESRWFPDDVRLEDAHFGGEPIPDGPSEAERAFEAAAAQSKTLRKAPDNETLLALYALYKQGSLGDVTGARPGVMDVVGRSKYDAWSSKRGMAREVGHERVCGAGEQAQGSRGAGPCGRLRGYGCCLSQPARSDYAESGRGTADEQADCRDRHHPDPIVIRRRRIQARCSTRPRLMRRIRRLAAALIRYQLAAGWVDQNVQRAGIVEHQAGRRCHRFRACGSGRRSTARASARAS